MARLMLRTRVTSIFIFAAGFVIYYFVRMESCIAWTASASGYMPLHLIMTTKIGVLLYMHTPSNARGKDHVLRVRPKVSGARALLALCCEKAFVNRHKGHQG